MEHQVWMDFLRDSKNTVHSLSAGQHEKLAETVKKLQRNKEKRTVGIRAHKYLGIFQAYSFRCVRGVSDSLVTPWTAAHQAFLYFTVSQSSLKLMSTESVISSNHLTFCHPSSPPALNLSQHQGFFSSESVLRIRWLRYWSFSFSISPSNEYSGLISFRIDWLDLLAVQRTLKSLLQHHSSKASILWHSAFFIVQLSHPYMTTGKTIAFTRQAFVGKVSFLFKYAL